MRSIFQNLYYGKIIPWERRNRHSEEQQKIVRQIGEEEDRFVSRLLPEDSERYQKLVALRSTLYESEESGLFAYSLTLGVMLILGILDEAEAMGFLQD